MSAQEQEAAFRQWWSKRHPRCWSWAVRGMELREADAWAAWLAAVEMAQKSNPPV